MNNRTSTIFSTIHPSSDDIASAWPASTQGFVVLNGGEDPRLEWEVGQGG